MKSTGEVMAIGRTIEEGLLKAIRSLEVDRMGLEPTSQPGWSKEALVGELVTPTDNRLYAIAESLRRGYKVETIVDLTKWNPFFVMKIRNIIQLEEKIKQLTKKQSPRANRDWKNILVQAKRTGFSNEYLADLTGETEENIRTLVKKSGVRLTYKMVDTCAAEFEATTPYFYSTYETETETKTDRRKTNPKESQTASQGKQSTKLSKVLIVGSGPIRIGQGIEFDYCCVHGVMALREAGIRAIIINNNPETVSTDYDISDRLYFEPLTFEDVMNVIEQEKPDGVILQFGGQTSVNLAVPLQQVLNKRPDLPTRILGTSSVGMDLAEDRRKFEKLLKSKNIIQPRAATGYSFEEVSAIAEQIGYPILVRPSYVLGGKGMEIVHNEKDLEFYMAHAVRVSRNHPVLVDKYLSNAIEIDVDSVSDGQDVFIGGIMEHIEQAGVHSGDAACVLPPQTLSPVILDEIRRVTRKLSQSLGVVGLMNLQLAVKDDQVYVLEAKAKVATAVMMGHKLKEMDLVGEAVVNHIAVKMPVFPFQKLIGLDAILGPEMKSTGEVMGLAAKFDEAYAKACLAAGQSLPRRDGTVYLTVCNEDKKHLLPIAKKLVASGLKIVATKGTSSFLHNEGIPVMTIWRISEKRQPNALTLMRQGQVQLIINTPTEGSGPKRDGYRMRRLAVELGIPFITTLAAARAAASGIEMITTESRSGLSVKSLNNYLKTMPFSQRETWRVKEISSLSRNHLSV
jgi:carbamoyl-phosphate synthase large subunit